MPPLFGTPEGRGGGTFVVGACFTSTCACLLLADPCLLTISAVAFVKNITVAFDQRGGLFPLIRVQLAGQYIYIYMKQSVPVGVLVVKLLVGGLWKA